MLMILRRTLICCYPGHRAVIHLPAANSTSLYLYSLHLLPCVPAIDRWGSGSVCMCQGDTAPSRDQWRPAETMEPVFPRSSSVPGARWRGWPLLDTTVCCLGLVWSPANYDLYPLMSGYSSACVAQNLDRAGGISIPSCRAPYNVYKLQANPRRLWPLYMGFIRTAASMNTSHVIF